MIFGHPVVLLAVASVVVLLVLSVSSSHTSVELVTAVVELLLLVFSLTSRLLLFAKLVRNGEVPVVAVSSVDDMSGIVEDSTVVNSLEAVDVVTSGMDGVTMSSLDSVVSSQSLRNSSISLLPSGSGQEHWHSPPYR